MLGWAPVHMALFDVYCRCRSTDVHLCHESIVNEQTHKQAYTHPHTYTTSQALQRKTGILNLRGIQHIAQRKAHLLPATTAPACYWINVCEQSAHSTLPVCLTSYASCFYSIHLCFNKSSLLLGGYVLRNRISAFQLFVFAFHDHIWAKGAGQKWGVHLISYEIQLFLFATIFKMYSVVVWDSASCCLAVVKNTLCA